MARTKVVKKTKVKEKTVMSALLAMSESDLGANIFKAHAELFDLRDAAAAHLRTQRLPDSDKSKQKKVPVHSIPMVRRNIARMKMVLGDIARTSKKK